MDYAEYELHDKIVTAVNKGIAAYRESVKSFSDDRLIAAHETNLRHYVSSQYMDESEWTMALIDKERYHVSRQEIANRMGKARQVEENKEKI